MTTKRTFSIWNRQAPTLLIPIVLMGSIPMFIQKTSGRPERTLKGKPVGAIEWTRIEPTEPAVGKTLVPTHEPIGLGVPVARATGTSAQIKVIFVQLARATANRHIIVSIPDKRLYLIKHGKIIRQYNALLGDANEPTPTGEFRITERISSNGAVTGKAWMRFQTNNDGYYGIHGRGPEHDKTSTSGCVALKNKDVVDLFRRVSKGDPVTIIGTAVRSTGG